MVFVRLAWAFMWRWAIIVYCTTMVMHTIFANMYSPDLSVLSSFINTNLAVYSLLSLFIIFASFVISLIWCSRASKQFSKAVMRLRVIHDEGEVH